MSTALTLTESLPSVASIDSYVQEIGRAHV